MAARKGGFGRRRPLGVWIKRLVTGIVGDFRQVDALAAQAKSIANTVRTSGTADLTHSRERKKDGSLKTNQLRQRREFAGKFAPVASKWGLPMKDSFA